MTAGIAIEGKRRALSKNIGNQQRLGARDFVAQTQFPLFQPRHLELIVPSAQDKSSNLGIEIAMLGPQEIEVVARILLIHRRMVTPTLRALNARIRFVARVTGFTDSKGDKADQKWFDRDPQAKGEKKP